MPFPEALDALHLDLLFRLSLAAVLGGVIGLEREFSGKPAGFRTNLLICVGATLLTDLSITMPLAWGSDSGIYDPTRIAAQIVSGIGFLGAGTIMQARGSVTGLTTAATLWVVAAIGMAVGARAYVEAIGTTILVMVALMLLGRIESWVVRRRRVERRLVVTMDADAAILDQIRDTLIGAGLLLDAVEVTKEQTELTAIVIVSGTQRDWATAKRRLIDLAGVRRVSGI